MLYLESLQPTTAPFATSHSLNEYAGINSRSSDQLRDKLPEALRSGITAKCSRVEGWPNELTFSILHGENDCYSIRIDGDTFLKAAAKVAVWQDIEKHHVRASILRSALVRAPLMPDRASSILHIWQALEAVFGKGPELSFRMSLTLAELCWPIAARPDTYELAKISYKDRSLITHGRTKTSGVVEWVRAWELLKNAVRGILYRKAIPSEDELFRDLLSR